MQRLLPFVLSIFLFLPVAQADDVTDTIESALTAYQEGDIDYTLEELNFAIQLLGEMKGASFSAFLPAPLEGWTMEPGDSSSAMVSMFGGGTSAEGIYSRDGQDFSITMMADNPMVTSMGAMLSNPSMISASGGKVLRVGRQKFALQDDQISGMINNRILIQASGDASVDDMVAHIETIDFDALGAF